MCQFCGLAPDDDRPTAAELAAEEAEWQRRNPRPRARRTDMPADASDFAPRPAWRSDAANQTTTITL